MAYLWDFNTCARTDEKVTNISYSHRLQEYWWAIEFIVNSKYIMSGDNDIRTRLISIHLIFRVFTCKCQRLSCRYPNSNRKDWLKYPPNKRSDIVCIKIECHKNYLLWMQSLASHVHSRVYYKTQDMSIDMQYTTLTKHLGIWPGPHLNIKTVFSGMGIPMLKIRRSRDRRILKMAILYW